MKHLHRTASLGVALALFTALTPALADSTATIGGLVNKGLVGAGRSEVAQTIFGLDESSTGKIFLHGMERKFSTPDEALAAGIGLLPEDRKRQGLVLSMNCRENGSLAALPLVTRGGFLQKKQEREMVRAYTEQLRVKTPGLEAPISGLSAYQ